MWSTLDRITFESVGAKSQIQVPLEFSPLMQPARLNCLLQRAGLRSAPLHIISWSILPSPTSVSLRLYCREPARTPSCTSLTLLLVHAPHLVLSAVVLQRACSHSLVHFLRAPPGRCSPPRSLCSCTVESLLVLLLVLTFLALFPRTPLGRWLLTGSLCGYTARACSCSP